MLFRQSERDSCIVTSDAVQEYRHDLRTDLTLPNGGFHALCASTTIPFVCLRDRPARVERSGLSAALFQKCDAADGNSLRYQNVAVVKVLCRVRMDKLAGKKVLARMVSQR
jgi:hypothetical protein